MSMLDSYICPKCSGKPVKLPIKRNQPSNADIEILLTALAEIDEEKPKMKKRQWDIPSSSQKVSVFHLAEPINTGRHNNVIGYIRNDSHPNPNEDNGNIVAITLSDIERGIVPTIWGNYKASATNDGRLLVSKDYSFKSPIKDFRKEEDVISNNIPCSRIQITNANNICTIKCEGRKELNIPTKDFSYNFDPEKSKSLAEMLNTSCSLQSIKEAINSRIKHKPSILLKLN